MSKQLHTTPETSEQKALGMIIDQLIDRKMPDVAEAVYSCAIPHWFNDEILSWLRGEKDGPSARTTEILSELAGLTFVSPYPGRGYVYDENIRKLLLGRWQKQRGAEFQKLSSIAAAYYADRLEIMELSEGQRAELEREEMYHLLVADEGYGIGLCKNLLERASLLYQLSTFDLLLNLAREQLPYLSASNRHWIPFFEGKRALLSGDWQEAQRVWESFAGERAQISVDLEKMLAAHLSILYKDMGMWDKAIKRFQDSLKILEFAGDKRGMAITSNRLGFLYKDKGLMDEADQCFQNSLKILEEIDDKVGVASTYNNLGLLYKDRKIWGAANKYFRLGLTNLQKPGNGRSIQVSIRNNLGFLYKDRGKWEKAKEHFQNSFEILEDMGDEDGMAAVSNSLGFLYTDMGKWGEAIRYFRRALKILEKIGDERRKVDTLIYLGNLYRDKKAWKKADEHFQQALIILKKISDERGKAAILNNLGLLYQHKGDQERAAYYFLRSLRIVEKVGDEMNATTTMYELARLYEDMEIYEEAIELMEKVAKIYEQVGHPDLRIRKSREILERVKAKASSSENDSDH